MTDTKTPESEANAEVNGDKLKGPDVASAAPVFASAREIEVWRFERVRELQCPRLPERPIRGPPEPPGTSRGSGCETF